MTTTPITPAALSPQREAEIREWRDELGKGKTFAAVGPYTALRDALAELDRVRAENARLLAERHETNDALADLTVAQRAERDAAEAEVASSNAQWEHWAREAEALRKRVAELEAQAAQTRATTFREAARLLEDTGHDDDAVNLLDNLADAHEPGGTAFPAPTYRAGQLAEQRHTFLDLDPDSACCPPGFVCPAAHTAPELEATR